MEYQQFINFLKRNNCYEQFVEDFEKYPNIVRLNNKCLSRKDIEAFYNISCNENCNMIWHSLIFLNRKNIPSSKYAFWLEIYKKMYKEHLWSISNS